MQRLFAARGPDPIGPAAAAGQPFRLRAVILLAVAGVLAVISVAAWSLHEERARLLTAFAAAQREVAGQIAADVDRQLGELEIDARLVTATIDRERARYADTADARESVRAGFDALATVVRHYRAISLFADDRLIAMSLDPSEKRPEVAGVFGQWSARAARHVAVARESALEGPLEGPDGRQFLIYGRTAQSGDTVVMISEAKFLLEPVLRSRGKLVQYFLVDASRSLWIGCGQPWLCRAFSERDWQRNPDLAGLMEAALGPDGMIWDDASLAGALALPPRPVALAWQSLRRDGRRWTAGVAASTQRIDSHESSLFRRLIATSIALLVAMGGIAALIVAQQRRAAALGERLRHAQEVAQLREAVGKLFDNVSVGLMGVTRDGRVRVMNRWVMDRLARGELGTALAEALSASDPAVSGDIRRELDDALSTGRPRFIGGGEVKVAATEPMLFDVRIVPLDQPASDVTALVLIEDLSELRKLQKQLVRAEKLVTVGVLTAGLAHEIGTPLGIIRGRAEVLLSKLEDGGARRDLDSIIRQIDQIERTIRQVLDFAHTQPVELSAVAPRDAIDSVLSLIEWRLRAKQISVAVETDGVQGRTIAADSAQLQQVLVNLLLNACDACARGGHITVTARPADDDRAVTLEIRDDGCGIAAENLHTVFDPFFTTKKRGEGTGLGLPVAASIVRNHQGTIALTSEPDKGTTVVVTWPRWAERARAHA